MPDTPMTDARLDEVETRLRKATPGEWYIDADGDLGKHTLASTHSGYTLIGAFDVGEPDNDEPNPDTVLVEHATSDMRDLLAEVRRARAAEAEARAALAEARRDALIEARSIARAEAIRLEDQFLDHSRGARCVAYLLTRALKESQ